MMRWEKGETEWRRGRGGDRENREINKRPGEFGLREAETEVEQRQVRQEAVENYMKTVGGPSSEER